MKILFYLLLCLSSLLAFGNQQPEEPVDPNLYLSQEGGFQFEVTPQQGPLPGTTQGTPGQQQFFGQLQAIQDAIRNIQNMEIQIDPNSIDLGPEFYAYLNSDEFKASIAQYLQENQPQDPIPVQPESQADLIQTDTTLLSTLVEAQNILPRFPDEIPCLLGETTPLTFQTPSHTPEGIQLREVAAQADFLECSSQPFQVASGVASKLLLLEADNSYQEGDALVGERSLELAREIVNTALGYVPVVGNVLDAVTAVTGYNVITGKTVSGLERVLAATSVFMPKIVAEVASSSGKIVGKALPKVLEKIGKMSQLEGKAGQLGTDLAVAAQRDMGSLNSALRNAELSGFNLTQLHPGNKIDDVIVETLVSNHNVTSQFVLTSHEALEAGIKWVGPKHSQIAPGVYRSQDNMRQFRIDTGSLEGAHRPNVPHVHFESFTPQEINKFKANNHVKIEGD